MNTLVNKSLKCLSTLLCWLQSVDCDAEVFDTVSKYGEFPMSLDEAVAEILYYVDTVEDKLHRRNVQIAELSRQCSNCGLKQQLELANQVIGEYSYFVETEKLKEKCRSFRLSLNA